jgi:hypothetical protein
MQSRPKDGLPQVSVDDLHSTTQIVIPHRSPKLTRSALKYASRLGESLEFRLHLIDVHVVPYGFALDDPDVNPKHLTRRLRSLAQESDLPVFAEVVYARDWEYGFRRSLAPRSVVLIPIQGTWWRRTREKRLAARLRSSGHQVIWVEAE